MIIIREAGVSDNNIAQLETLVRNGELSPGAAADSVIEMMMNKVQSGKLLWQDLLTTHLTADGQIYGNGYVYLLKELVS